MGSIEELAAFLQFFKSPGANLCINGRIVDSGDHPIFALPRSKVLKRVHEFQDSTVYRIPEDVPFVLFTIKLLIGNHLTIERPKSIPSPGFEGNGMVVWASTKKQSLVIYDAHGEHFLGKRDVYYQGDVLFAHDKKDLVRGYQ